MSISSDGLEDLGQRHQRFTAGVLQAPAHVLAAAGVHDDMPRPTWIRSAVAADIGSLATTSDTAAANACGPRIARVPIASATSRNETSASRRLNAGLRVLTNARRRVPGDGARKPGGDDTERRGSATLYVRHGPDEGVAEPGVHLWSVRVRSRPSASGVSVDVERGQCSRPAARARRRRNKHMVSPRTLGDASPA
jgi:hypothetical protein